MDLSVVVPTLNDRERLEACLDALSTHAPDAEVVVVNGPSTDGTTGMVRARDDVAELVEIAERTVNVARNAGLSAATGDVVALLANCCCPRDGWLAALEDALADGAEMVTGPVGHPNRPDVSTQRPERRTIAGRDVTYFDGENVAFRRSTIDALDGFDEYLATGGARDAAHRLAGMAREVTFVSTFAVTRDGDSATDPDERDLGWKYRALAYRLVKNYGPRPTAFRRTGSHAVADGFAAGKHVARGEIVPSRWVANGRDVLTGGAVGAADGLRARYADRSPARNPNGLSSRSDRAVKRYDFR
jgi:glycosyltransferase involved in cell wall biosynthesis